MKTSLATLARRPSVPVRLGFAAVIISIVGTIISQGPAQDTDGNHAPLPTPAVGETTDGMSQQSIAAPGAVEMMVEPLFAPPASDWMPASMHPICGVYCPLGQPCNEARWRDWGPIPWEIFAQGEYVGPHRLPHVPEYRLRVDDVVEFVYRLTAEQSTRPYRFNVGDEIKVQSLTDASVETQLIVQPDGSITLALLGQVQAADLTVEELTAHLEKQYSEFIEEPSIVVVPIEMNNRLEELRATVDNRAGVGGQSREVRVTPEGTLQLPALGSIPVVGLSLDELKREVDIRYAALVEGMEVTPILLQRAPRHIYVLGEVAKPGRFELVGPTTLIQSIALAGSWNVGAYLDHIVVLRRDNYWNLMATKLDIRGALFGCRPCPADEIWLRDSDIVIVPKSPIKATTDLLDLVFTRGVYTVVPFSANYTQGNFSSF